MHGHDSGPGWCYQHWATAGPAPPASGWFLPSSGTLWKGAAIKFPWLLRFYIQVLWRHGTEHTTMYSLLGQLIADKINPLGAKFFRGNIIIYSHFDAFMPHWRGCNPSSCKTRTYLFYIVNIMAADDLVTQWGRASVTMIFTMLNRINADPAC